MSEKKQRRKKTKQKEETKRGRKKERERKQNKPLVDDAMNEEPRRTDSGLHQSQLLLVNFLVMVGGGGTSPHAAMSYMGRQLVGGRSLHVVTTGERSEDNGSVDFQL